MERRRFSQTMASEWQTAFVVSHKMPWCALITAVKNCNKSLEKLQDFFFKTKCSKTKTKTETFIFVTGKCLVISSLCSVLYLLVMPLRLDTI